MADDCYTCRSNGQVATLPPRETIVIDGIWRVAHAFDSSLPGWLVVVPSRHVESLDELTGEEVGPLGDLLRRASAALREVVGATKSYVMLFAESEGFHHLHLHVVPRMPDFTADQRGPQVFTFLGRHEAEQVSAVDQDELAVRLAAAMQSA